MSSFDAAVTAMHTRLDDWAEAVRAAGASAQGDEALDDPRLGAAEEEFDTAVQDFHRAASTLLGLPAAGEDDGPVVEAEELALHLLVGLPADVPDPARPAASVVHAAGERLVADLHAAGYQVPAWQLGCEVDVLLDEEDEP